MTLSQNSCQTSYCDVTEEWFFLKETYEIVHLEFLVTTSQFFKPSLQMFQL